MERRIRILLAKPGLDGHDRGAKRVARVLKEAGCEIVYLQFATPERIAQSAIEEDVDIIALSFLSGAHTVLVPRIVDCLKNERAEDIKIIVGGTIPKRDVELLKSAGVTEVFPQHVQMDEVVNFVNKMALTISQK